MNLLVKLLKRRPVDLTRENLGLVPSWRDFTDSANDNNTDYLRTAEGVLKSRCFLPEINKLIQAQITFIAEKCPNEQSMLLARGTINGLCLIKERLEMMQSIYIQRQEKQKNINSDYLDSALFN